MPMCATRRLLGGCYSTHQAARHCKPPGTIPGGAIVPTEVALYVHAGRSPLHAQCGAPTRASVALNWLHQLRFQTSVVKSVIVISAGLEGLVAAGQLLSFGFRVLVLEGRNRPRGRVYTQRMTGALGASVAVDLGGSVITGIHANPLGVLARQVGAPLHMIRWENCRLYDPDGAQVSPELDAAVDFVFNQILEKESCLSKTIGEAAAGGISLGSTMETLRRLYGVVRSDEERELLNWHLANLEYTNTGKLSDLSVAHWDQDDPYEMGGDHCFLAGGNGRLVHAMAIGLPVLYGKSVTRIKY